MRINDALTNDEIRELLRPSDWRGFQALATTWAMIAGSLAGVAFYPGAWSVALALVILGGRHLSLAILMHDASHYSLFRTRKLNDWLGRWLCAYPTWQDLRRYRVHHLAHHKWAGSPQDPDIDLVAGYPTSRRSLLRKFARDLTGISGVKRAYGLLLMDFGYIEYTVSSRVTRLDQSRRGARERLRDGAKNLHGVLLTNLALFAACAASGHPGLYSLWILSYLTTFSLFVRIRSIAEHACTEPDLDPMKSTRTTLANPLARLTVAPLRVNFHLEHHLAMTIPYFNLPRTHQLLRDKGALQDGFVAQGYLEVLEIATRGN